MLVKKSYKLHVPSLTIIQAIFYFLVLFSPLQALDENKLKQLPERSQIIYRFIGIAGNKIGKRFNSNPCAFGAGKNESGKSVIITAFQRQGVGITEQEARHVILAYLDAFVKEANQDEKLKSVMGGELTIDNIEISICNYTKNMDDYFHPFVSTIFFEDNQIIYFTNNPINNRNLTEKYETYEEALAILKKEQEDKVIVRDIIELDIAQKKRRKR